MLALFSDLLMTVASGVSNLGLGEIVNWLIKYFKPSSLMIMGLVGGWCVLAGRVGRRRQELVREARTLTIGGLVYLALSLSLGLFFVIYDLLAWH